MPVSHGLQSLVLFLAKLVSFVSSADFHVSSVQFSLFFILFFHSGLSSLARSFVFFVSLHFYSAVLFWLCIDNNSTQVLCVSSIQTRVWYKNNLWLSSKEKSFASEGKEVRMAFLMPIKTCTQKLYLLRTPYVSFFEKKSEIWHSAFFSSLDSVLCKKTAAVASLSSYELFCHLPYLYVVSSFMEKGVILSFLFESMGRGALFYNLSGLKFGRNRCSPFVPGHTYIHTTHIRTVALAFNLTQLKNFWCRCS